MFIVSFSGKKIKAVILFAVVLAAIITTLCIIGALSSEKEASDNTAFSTQASDADERLSFIRQFGWIVDETAAEVCEVLIPAEFDDVYTNYNNIQIAQGLNLEPYAGVRVKRWTYIVKNYPGYGEDVDYIRINLLVHNGEVIGGDVCSVELDGFMHGFKKE